MKLKERLNTTISITVIVLLAMQVEAKNHTA